MTYTIKKRDGRSVPFNPEKIQNAVLLPVAFTISIPLCLLGRFDEVYNASYYFTGILLLTAAVYLVLRIIILLKKGKCYL